ncbi:MAG: hypothetical protein HRF45_10405 [Fimbriimonadia bacterium]
MEMMRQVHWHECAVIVAFLLGPCAMAAEIAGRIHFKGDLTEVVKVGYEGVTASGVHITNMAGLMPTGSSAYVWCDTYKPRRTGLVWSSAEGLTFRHTNLPKGTYFTYVKHGDTYLDWKVITVSSDSARINTSLAISPSRMGDVEIAVTKGPGTYQVLLVPATEHGTSPIRGADLARGFGPAIEAEITGDSVMLSGVRDGSYRLVLRSIRRQGNGSILTDVGSWTILVKAGKSVRYSVP